MATTAPPVAIWAPIFRFSDFVCNLYLSILHLVKHIFRLLHFAVPTCSYDVLFVGIVVFYNSSTCWPSLRSLLSCARMAELRCTVQHSMGALASTPSRTIAMCSFVLAEPPTSPVTNKTNQKMGLRWVKNGLNKRAGVKIKSISGGQKWGGPLNKKQIGTIQMLN